MKRQSTASPDNEPVALALITDCGYSAFLHAYKGTFVCGFKNGHIICNTHEPITINRLSNFYHHSIDERPASIAALDQRSEAMRFIESRDAGGWSGQHLFDLLRPNPGERNEKDIAGSDVS